MIETIYRSELKQYKTLEECAVSLNRLVRYRFLSRTSASKLLHEQSLLRGSSPEHAAVYTSHVLGSS